MSTAARRAFLALAFALVTSPTAFAQAPDAQTEQPAAAPDAGAVYKPPLRGAPGGRVGGASRGIRLTKPLPAIELIAPPDHTGETASATPVLYFFVAQPVTLPTQFTISAPLRAAPILETTIPSPTAPGLYRLGLADYHLRLEPGIVYTWSVSAIADPKNWSRNAVSSATIRRVAPDATLNGAVRAAPPERRASLLAGASLWYDAVAAAADAQNVDRHAALDELLTEIGLTGPASFDRAQAGGAPSAK
jgi:hypothetical protein